MRVSGAYFGPLELAYVGGELAFDTTFARALAVAALRLALGARRMAVRA